MPLIQPITTASGTSSFVPLARTLTINGVSYDLSADRTWTISGLGSLIATAPLSFNSGTSTISISQASGSSNGYLSSTDWTTFNSKVGGSGTTNYVSKFTASSTLGNSLIYDNGTNVGINTASPAANLHVVGTFISDALWNSAGVTYWGSYSTAYGALTWNSTYASVYATTGNALYLGSNGTTNHAILNTSGNFGLGLSPSYKLDVSGQVRISDALAIGTTPDTTLPFKIEKNINSTVGIRFQNTNTGSTSFTAVQFGTDVNGGTAFCNLVYASSGITESGVFKPNGTSLVNTGSGGLNFLSVSQPIRFFTSSANGTLRLELVNNGFLNHYNGTNPSASVTDGYSQYSADVVAGNAAPHFRTENGAVIKLYQETTAVGNSIISLGGGSAVLDDTTFDGYTLRQIVKALRNQGILA